MCPALLCSSSGGKIALHSLWYRHTETSEWSKLTKTQFYKYEQIVAKLMCEFFECFTYNNHVTSCKGYVYPVTKLIRKVLCLFTIYVCL